MSIHITRLDPKTFATEFGESFNQIFKDPLALQPFGNRKWEKALLPYGLNLCDRDFQALAGAATAVGDSLCVIIEVESLDSEREGLAVPWTRKAFEDVHVNSKIGHLITALFGESAEWGMICDPRTDYSFLAGSIAFMNHFYRIAGSRPVVKQRFFTFAANEWIAPENEKQELLSLVNWREAH